MNILWLASSTETKITLRIIHQYQKSHLALVHLHATATWAKTFSWEIVDLLRIATPQIQRPDQRSSDCILSPTKNFDPALSLSNIPVHQKTTLKVCRGKKIQQRKRITELSDNSSHSEPLYESPGTTQRNDTAVKRQRRISTNKQLKFQRHNLAISMQRATETQ